MKNFNLSDEKLTAICALVPDMTADAVADYIDGSEGTGWGSESDNAEHQTWLDTADAATIAAWVRDCN